MKKLIVVALLSLTISGIAQEKKKDINTERPQFTTEQQQELEIKKLTLELDLTAQQQKEISKIVEQKHAKRAAKKAEFKNKKAENKKLTTDDKFVLKRDLLDEKIAYKNEMKKILTPEQIEKWEKTQKHKIKRDKHLKKRKLEIKN